MSKSISPRPGTALVLNLAGSYRVDGAPGPDAAIFGIRDRSICLEVGPGWTHRIQVQFSPCGLSRFIETSATSLADNVVPAREYFPAGAVERLADELAAVDTFPERAQILDRFLLDNDSNPSETELAIHDLAARICANPDVPLRDLLRALPTSLRQTERYFSRLVGVNPRRLARIARFERARERLIAAEDSTLTEVGLSAGYYDQAHFGREFKRMASLTPGSYSFCPPARLPAHQPARSRAG